MASFKALLTALVDLAKRWPGLIALFGFVSGAASYLLVERSESLAQVIAIVMLVSWVWLVLENWLRAGFLQRFGLDMPPALMHYVTQMVHQESLFFVLPFFLAVTSWDHGQAIFTALLVLCALISVIDPLYYKQLAPRRSLFVAFHALALFAVLLVALPLILHLTTAQSLALALLMSMVFSLPSLLHLLDNRRWWRLPLMALMLTALAAGLWQARAWVPPAALQLTGISLSLKIDRQMRTPGASLEQITAATLKENGLFAWTAVRAPRGLREKIHHAWFHNGREVDRITVDIRGGRTEGYRAWTHKSNFPRDPAGKWQVRVVTDSGQLIGLARFSVAGESVAGGIVAGDSVTGGNDTGRNVAAESDIPVTDTIGDSNPEKPPAESSVVTGDAPSPGSPAEEPAEIPAQTNQPAPELKTDSFPAPERSPSEDTAEEIEIPDGQAPDGTSP